jgi:Hydantoin racemase
LNPNGNPVVNGLLHEVALRVLPKGTAVKVLNPAGSPLSIETPADRAVAEPLAIEILAGNPRFDAYVMACFDDIALKAGRRLLRAPVVGAVEASVAFARLRADRFTIVTTVDTAVPGIRRVLSDLGAESRCMVRAAGMGVAAAASGDDVADRQLDMAIELARDQDGAEAIILGSAGLAGRAGKLQKKHGLPVIDAMEAAIRLALASVRSCGP